MRRSRTWAVQKGQVHGPLRSIGRGPRAAPRPSMRKGVVLGVAFGRETYLNWVGCYSNSNLHRRSTPRLPSVDEETSLMLSYDPWTLSLLLSLHSMSDRSSRSSLKPAVTLALRSFVNRLPTVSCGSVLPVTVEYALPNRKSSMIGNACFTARSAPVAAPRTLSATLSPMPLACNWS